MSSTAELVKENLELIRAYIEDNSQDFNDLKRRVKDLEGQQSNGGKLFSRVLQHFKSPSNHPSATKEPS